MNERIATQLTSVHNVVMLAALLGIALTGSIAISPTTSDTLAQREHSGKVAQTQETTSAQSAVAAVTNARKEVAVLAPSATFGSKLDGYYEQLRNKMNWLPVRYAGSVLQTPDAQSRLLLTRAAAKHAGLEEVGLSYRDVYGIIYSETSWIPRMGSSKNGTPNLGIAQFEPATAKAVGLTDPSDPVQAVHAAAVHLKDAALWSAKRIASLKLSPEQHATKLREGVSIYYNLSVKGRNKWNGLNTAKLPIETRRHIANARTGAREAAELEQQLADVKARVNNGERMMTASLRSN
jgi:hypothetical protein